VTSTGEAWNGPKSTITLGLLVAAKSPLTLDELAKEARDFNRGISDNLHVDMIVVLSRGTISYAVQFAGDQSVGDWLPPAQNEHPEYILPILLHLIITSTAAFALNRMIAYVVGHLAFFAPSMQAPNMHEVSQGVPAQRDIVCTYQYNLAGSLIEFENTAQVLEPPFIIEDPKASLLSRLFFTPWQDGGVIIAEGLLPLEGLLIFAPKKVPLVSIKRAEDSTISTVLTQTAGEFSVMIEQISKRSNLSVRRETTHFTIGKMMDEGTSTPFVARLCMTPLTLRDAVFFDQEKKGRFDTFYGSIIADLISLRRIGRETVNLWKTHEQKVTSGEIARYDKAIRVDEFIQEPLTHNIETIIKNIASTTKQFQNLTALFGINIGFMYQNIAAYDAGLQALEANDPMLATYLCESRKWLEPLTLMRGELEHKPYIAPQIQYVRAAENRIRVQEPHVLGLPLTAFVEVMLNRLNRYVEEVLTWCIQRTIMSPLVIAEIPLGFRDPDKTERFKLAFVGMAQPWIIFYSDEDFDQV